MGKRTRRTFSADFKAQVVLRLLTGEQTQAELCRQHDLKPELVSHWKATAKDRLATLFEGAAAQDPEQARIAELEQLAGKQALEIEVLKKASRMLLGPGGKNGTSPAS